MREENLGALASRNPGLAARIRQAEPNPDILFTAARTGDLVPCARGLSRPLALHSLADPRREGERMAASLEGAGFVVALALGAGYHLIPLLQRPDLAAILIIEKDPATLKALLGGPDMRALLSDPRVLVAAEENPAGIERLVLSAYIPALAGDLRTLPLRPWCEHEKAYFQSAAAGVRAAAEAIRADVGTQARFGKRWFANIVLNLRQAENAPDPAPSRREALVTAAGPSLEGCLPEIASRRAEATLIASDTSFPALAAAGIRPDVVLSIDCQLYGYNHFLSSPLGGAPLLLDLASPPLLARLSPRCSFFASRHPLCEYLARRWKPLPTIDTSGGNVTHAAVSLAAQLGAHRVTLYGADFSYPSGKSYARGTYLYDVFGSRSLRCEPLESSFFAFLFRSGDAAREGMGGSFRYTTPLLLRYRDDLQRLSRRIGAEVTAARGDGLPLDLGRGGGRLRVEWPTGPTRCGWKDFLKDYAQGLRRAPAARHPLPAWFAGLPVGDRELWGTLLPVAAAVRREEGGAGPASCLGSLEHARQWALERLSLVLSEHDPGIPDE